MEAQVVQAVLELSELPAAVAAAVAIFVKAQSTMRAAMAATVTQVLLEI